MARSCAVIQDDKGGTRVGILNSDIVSMSSKVERTMTAQERCGNDLLRFSRTHSDDGGKHADQSGFLQPARPDAGISQVPALRHYPTGTQ